MLSQGPARGSFRCENHREPHVEGSRRASSPNRFPTSSANPLIAHAGDISGANGCFSRTVAGKDLHAWIQFYYHIAHKNCVAAPISSVHSCSRAAPSKWWKATRPQRMRLRSSKRHPIGSRAYLALVLLLYAGQRCSDVVRMAGSTERRTKIPDPGGQNGS